MIDIRKWYQTRGPNFIWHRGQNLWARYGLGTKKSETRIEECLLCLNRQGCSPTFPVPALVLQKHPQFISHLASLGVEIAVHGYNHVDLKICSPQQASQELQRAAEVFRQFGFEPHGFRCPYLSCTDEMIHALPPSIFDYSSNRAIRWKSPQKAAAGNEMVETLNRFYVPLNADESVCVPWIQDYLVEIPVCIPDDLQLFDGYHLTPSEVAQAWVQIIDKVHRTGELFTPMFHPELFLQCIEPLVEILQEASRYQPKVWITRLAEIAEWWLEKEGFFVTVVSDHEKITLKFTCTPRATILLRDLSQIDGIGYEYPQPWDGRYRRIMARQFTLPAVPRPFIGISPDLPSEEIVFLREQGYILDTSEFARDCTIYLDKSRLAHFLVRPVRPIGSPPDGVWMFNINRRALIEWIEAYRGPLVRFWRWPDGYKCTLSLSGDLDALSLLDYSNRLFST